MTDNTIRRDAAVRSYPSHSSIFQLTLCHPSVTSLITTKTNAVKPLVGSSHGEAATVLSVLSCLQILDSGSLRIQPQVNLYAFLITLLCTSVINEKSCLLTQI